MATNASPHMVVFVEVGFSNAVWEGLVHKVLRKTQLKHCTYRPNTIKNPCISSLKFPTRDGCCSAAHLPATASA